MHNQQEFLASFRKVRKQTLNFSIEESRIINDKFFYTPLSEREKVAKILDEIIISPQGPTPIRLYLPKGTPPFPILLFFHWGGWVFGSIDNSDALCRKLCNATHAIIMSVDYRLAPEHPFPAALEDCIAAVKWAAKHAHEFCGDHKRIGVIGESAGGNLAAAVCLNLRDRNELDLSLQVLIYPLLSYNIDPNHYIHCPDQDFITAAGTKWFWDQYLSGEKIGLNPYICPFDSYNFKGLPKTVMVTAGHDPLRQDGLQYASCLKKDKVTVAALDYPHALHGFLNLPIDQAIVKKAIQDISQLIKLYLNIH